MYKRQAKLRVNGAMIDELRQMDHLSRPQRRKVKVVQVARQQWQAASDARPTAADLAGLCGLSVEEIFQAESDAQVGHDESSAPDAGDGDGPGARRCEPATAQDEGDYLGGLPLTMSIREQADSGRPSVVADPDGEIADTYRRIARTVAVRIAQQAKDFSSKFPTISVSKAT